MEKFIFPFKQGKLLNIVFLSNILLSFHYYLILYINSSFLNQFFTETQISTLYVVGSIINTILFLNTSKILNKIGNYKSAIYMLIIDFLATLGLVLTTSHFLLGLYFMLHIITVSFILFNLDVFLESVSKDESKTGGIRGMYLTLGNVVCVASPFMVAILLAWNTFWLVYLLSALFLIPMIYYIQKYFRKIQEVPVEHIKIKETIGQYLKNKNLYNVFGVHFLLQLFYAYMVIYTPLYLEKYVGFSWSEIGLIFTIMLLPFIIFEIPLGDLADKKYGEQEFMTVGLVVMGLATIFISFITVKSFLIWTTVLFITRIGASFVEVSTDSYFFKQVTQRQTNIISFYRLTRPLSLIIAPIIAMMSLQFIPFEYTFIIIGSLCIVGTHYALALQDTK